MNKDLSINNNNDRITTHKINFLHAGLFSFYYIFVLFIFYKVLSSPFRYNGAIIVIYSIIFVFMIYLTIVMINIAKEKYRKISVNYTKETITLLGSLQEEKINFKNIKHIKLYSGEVLRGILLGRVEITLESGKTYTITISNPFELSSELSHYVILQVKQSMFFPVKLK